MTGRVIGARTEDNDGALCELLAQHGESNLWLGQDDLTPAIVLVAQAGQVHIAPAEQTGQVVLDPFLAIAGRVEPHITDDRAEIGCRLEQLGRCPACVVACGIEHGHWVLFW